MRRLEYLSNTHLRFSIQPVHVDDEQDYDFSVDVYSFGIILWEIYARYEGMDDMTL